MKLGQVYRAGISRRRFAGAFSLVRSERTLTYADSKAAAISRNTRRWRQGRKTGDRFERIEILRYSCFLRRVAILLENTRRIYIQMDLCSSETRDCLIFEWPGKPLVCRARVFPPSSVTRDVKKARVRAPGRAFGGAFMPLPRELTRLNYTCAHFCICTRRWIAEGAAFFFFFFRRAVSSGIRLLNRERERDVHLSWAVSVRISLS